MGGANPTSHIELPVLDDSVSCPHTVTQEFRTEYGVKKTVINQNTSLESNLRERG